MIIAMHKRIAIDESFDLLYLYTIKYAVLCIGLRRLNYKLSKPYIRFKGFIIPFTKSITIKKDQTCFFYIFILSNFSHNLSNNTSQHLSVHINSYVNKTLRKKFKMQT